MSQSVSQTFWHCHNEEILTVSQTLWHSLWHQKYGSLGCNLLTIKVEYIRSPWALEQFRQAFLAIDKNKPSGYRWHDWVDSIVLKRQTLAGGARTTHADGGRWDRKWRHEKRLCGSPWRLHRVASDPVGSAGDDPDLWDGALNIKQKEHSDTLQFAS